MRASIHRPIPRVIFGALFASAAAAATAALGGCGDEADADRRSFDFADSAPDVDEPAPIGDGGVDGGVDDDAGEKRGPFNPADEPVTCADASPCATQLVAGNYHFCALMSDGTVRCWGDDEYGALGGGDDSDELTDAPVRVVAGVDGATQISAARATTCVRRTDGNVQCWGSNSQGQLGLEELRPLSDEGRHPEATDVALRDAAVRVDVGPDDVCAVLATGKLSCWGTNTDAQLARGSLDYVMGPGLAEIDPLAVARMGIGNTTSLALTTDGKVFSWGAVAGPKGYLSGRMSSISPDPLPNAITQLAKVTKLVVGESLYKDEGGPLGLAPPSIGPIPPPLLLTHGHACAIADGEVYCWGRSDTGALCTGLPDQELLPAHAPVKGPAWPQQLAVGDEITCARMTNGTIQCCGANGRGRLGTGQTELFSPFLKPIASFTRHAVQVATSRRAVCALVQGGSVECWGSNANGELGTGTPDDDAHPSPVKIAL